MKVLQIIGAIVGFFVVCAIVVGLVGLITTGSAFYSGAIAKVTAAPRVEAVTYDPNNIIAQRTFFTQTCNDVGADYSQWKTNESAVTQLEVQIKAGLLNDPTGTILAQAVAQAQGPQTALFADAQDYDARSNNPIADKFKPAGLPDRINPPVNLIGWMPPSCG